MSSAGTGERPGTDAARRAGGGHASAPNCRRRYPARLGQRTADDDQRRSSSASLELCGDRTGHQLRTRRTRDRRRRDDRHAVGLHARSSHASRSARSRLIDRGRRGERATSSVRLIVGLDRRPSSAMSHRGRAPAFGSDHRQADRCVRPMPVPSAAEPAAIPHSGAAAAATRASAVRRAGLEQLVLGRSSARTRSIGCGRDRSRHHRVVRDLDRGANSSAMPGHRLGDRCRPPGGAAAAGARRACRSDNAIRSPCGQK